MWRAETGSPKSRQFKIQHDPQVGFYLHVFEDGKCTHDYLQDTLEQAISQAEEQFGVARSRWQEFSAEL